MKALWCNDAKDYNCYQHDIAREGIVTETDNNDNEVFLFPDPEESEMWFSADQPAQCQTLR